MRKACLILLTLLAFSVATGYGAVYYWTGSTDLSWSTAANWSPIRSVSTTADTLIFAADSTVHDTVVGGAIETVAAIKLMPATNIWFQTASGKRTLSIVDSLIIPSGSSLSVISPTSAADTLVIYLNAGARASIDGSIAFNYFGTTTGPRHRLDAADSLAIQFTDGSTLVQNTIGNIFGSSAGNNRVVFNSGSQFIQYLGSNPFGVSAPGSKVLFKPGSWFRFRQGGTATPSFSGRTYANFQLDWSTYSNTSTGSSVLNIDTLLISDGRLNLQLRHINIKGALIVLDTLYFNSATTCSLYFNGSSQQTMDWSAANSFMFGTATNVFVDNPAGLLLNSNFVVNCKLHLTNGNIVTGSNEVLLTTDSTIVRSNGYVQGSLWRTIGAGTDVIMDYPVGNADGYTPATFTYANVSTAGGTSVSVIHNTHPSAVIPANTMQNYWSVSPTGGLVFDTCSVVLGYISSDFNTGFSEATDEENMVAGKFDTTAWSFPPVTARDTLNNTIQISEITGFSDFALGKNQEAFLGDLTPPYLVSTSPATGDSGVALDAPIIFAFSEPMDTLSLVGSMTPSPNEEPTWNTTMDTMTLNHDPMSLNTTYIVKLNAVTDLAGNPLSVLPDSVIFTTVVDTSHPYIVSTSPADGAVDVPLNEPVIIAFSEPIDPATFGGYNLPDISMSLSWNATFDTMTLTPDTLYEYNTTYTFYDTAGTDMFGNAIVGLPFSFGFTTIANQGPEITLVQSPNDTYDGTGPFIVRTVITDAAKAGIIADTLWYTDNKTDWWAIVHTSVDGDTFNYSIPGPLAAGTVIEFFFGAWDDGGAVQYDPSMYRGYQFRILDPLPPSGLAANSGNMQVSLGWAPPAEVLEYDTAPYAFWNWYAGDIFSTRFTPQHYPCKVEQTVSMWYDAGAGIDSIEVHIWPDNGNGIPDITTQLITPFKIMPDNYPNWTYIDLSPFNLVLSAGDFHVGYVCQSDNQPTPISDGGGPGIRTMVYDGSSWGNLVAMSVNYYDFNNKAAVTYSNYSKGLILKSYVPQNNAKPLPVLAGLKPTPLPSNLTAQYPELRGAMSLAKNISDYEVFRGDITGGPYTSLGTVSDTSYTDNTVINDNDYYYVVRANYSTPDTFSAWSNEASATPTGVEGKPEVNVFVLQLNPVTPNPVNNGKATFRFSLPEAAYVRLDVFNVLGQKLNTLVDGKKTAGLHNVNWNVTDRNGTKLASGVYIYQLSTMGKTLTKRMTIIK